MIPSINRTDRLLWASDLHILQFPPRELEKFGDDLRLICDNNPGAPLALAGDLGWQDHLHLAHLILDAEMSDIDTTVLTIRGNHDLKPEDVAATKEYMTQTRRFIDVHGATIELNERTCLIGENGYPDFRTLGEEIEDNIKIIPITKNSFPEFVTGDQLDPSGMYGIGRLMRAMADQATRSIIKNIENAFEQYDCAVLLTHYPPFREVAYHEGKMGLPHMCSGVVNVNLGEALKELMEKEKHRDKSVIVLCGHTHEAHSLSVLDNLTVHVGWGNRKKDAFWIGPPKIEVLELPS